MQDKDDFAIKNNNGNNNFENHCPIQERNWHLGFLCVCTRLFQAGLLFSEEQFSHYSLDKTLTLVSVFLGIYLEPTQLSEKGMCVCTHAHDYPMFLPAAFSLFTYSYV